MTLHVHDLQGAQEVVSGQQPARAVSDSSCWHISIFCSFIFTRMALYTNQNLEHQPQHFKMVHASDDRNVSVLNRLERYIVASVGSDFHYTNSALSCLDFIFLFCHVLTVAHHVTCVCMRKRACVYLCVPAYAVIGFCGRLAVWKIDLRSKTVGHPWSTG